MREPPRNFVVIKVIGHALLAILLLICAAGMWFDSLYSHRGDATRGGHIVGTINGRVWIAHLPNMSGPTLDAWWNTRRVQVGGKPARFGWWCTWEYGGRGWVLGVPMWIPLLIVAIPTGAAWIQSFAADRRGSKRQ